MAFLELHCYSRALSHQIALNVLLPQRHPWEPPYREPRQTLYLLHGLGDDHTGWIRRTGLERYLDGKNTAVVMPSTMRGFYTDMAGNGPKYWEFTAHELPELMEDFFNIKPCRETTFAAGLSMGGYGALKLAFKHPERFAGAAALSAAPISKLMAQAQIKAAENEDLVALTHRVFGPVITPDNDIFDLIETCAANTEVKPRLYFTCGESDYLLPLNQMLYQKSVALGFDSEMHTHPKEGHTWDYWDKVLPDVLRFIGN